MTQAQHVRLRSDELTSETLKDATIYGQDGSEVGHVSHLHGSGAACQVVIEVGGILGLGTKPVTVGLGQLEFMRGMDSHHVYALTQWTREQLEAMPAHQG